MKRGAYYERLAAAVAKVLEARSTVIHDLSLRGDDTGVKHQIDVVIERDGQKCRLLLECKDFSERSGDQDKVNLEVVRSFFGACHDIKPDEAAVVSATGFTKPATMYASGPACAATSSRAARSPPTHGWLS